MKFRNVRTGEIHDTKKGLYDSGFCEHRSCEGCPVGELSSRYPDSDIDCQKWIALYPRRAAELMGYELIRDPVAPPSTDIEDRVKVIAIDFDGTLFKTKWPEILEPNREVVDWALKEQQNGAKLILWTCREGDLLKDALLACAKEGLSFDAVNDSVQEWKHAWGTSPRKIGATEYWDDRAVNPKFWSKKNTSDGSKTGDTSPDVSSRRGILLQATKCVCGDRDQDYGSPEHSLSAIGSFWADYIEAKYGTEVPLTGADASAMMVLFKMARVATGHGKTDNWVDAAGYAACGGEIEGRKA